MARDRRDDDDDDTPRKPSRRRDEDDEDDREERSPRRRRDEDDEEPAPRRRAARDDDDDDRPRRRSSRDDGGSSGGKKLNVFGLISMILGIFSIVVTIFFGCCYGWIVGIVVGVVSLILGIVGMSAAKKSDGQMGGGMALAGTILSIITIVFAILWGLFFAAMFGIASSLPTSINTGTSGPVGGTGNPVSPSDPVGATVSAEEMALEFKNNGAAADVKYTGKIVEVTGVIDRVSPGGEFMDSELKLKGQGLTYVECNFGTGKQGVVSGLKSGQVVTVRGRYAGRFVGDPQLKDCIVMSGGGGAGGAGDGVLKVNATALAKEFANNAVGANAKYGNKMVEVSGTVVSIDRADPTVVKVTLGTGGKKEVECQVEAKDAAGLTGVRNAQQVKLRGKCVGDEDGLVVIEECTVVK